MTHASTSFPHLAHEINGELAAFRAGQPELMDGFGRMAKAATEPGSLSSKTKELMALALGVAARCDGCIAFHAKALVALQATRAEVEEALAVAVYMGGGPSLMYCANALAAFDQFRQKAAA